MIIQTNGSGLWSDMARDVRITAMEVFHAHGFGISELRVFFDVQTWNVYEDGLIYTDDLFETQLREFLNKCDFKDVKTVDYSEQGMQGKDFVSLDVSDEFADSFDPAVLKTFGIDGSIVQR